MDNLCSNSGALSSFCYFCNSSVGQYQCPRCQKKYCSVKCYNSRAHINCSESFYKSEVDSFLTDRKLHVGSMSNSDSIKDKQRLHHILSKYISQSSTEEEDPNKWFYKIPSATISNTENNITSQADSSSSKKDLADFSSNEDLEIADRSLTKTEEKELHDLIENIPVDDLLRLLTENEKDGFHKYLEDSNYVLEDG